MKRFFIIEWTDLMLPEWHHTTNWIFGSAEDAHRYAQRWYRLYSDESERYHVKEYFESIYGKEDF